LNSRRKWYSQMAQYIRAKSRMDKDMDSVFRYGQMVLSTKVSGGIM